jgi:DNA invertase Pin-like site-specific DNA recombinase
MAKWSSKMLIGYARVSTTEQDAGFEAQKRELATVGCEEFFCEKVSSVAERDQLKECLRFIRKGDTLVVTKLDRLARSMRDLIEIVDQVKDKGAELRILAMNLDTSNATGELMLNVLGSVAQFERSMMLERQREGIAKAKSEGKFKGRAPTAQRKSGDVIRMWSAGTKPPEIVDALGISLSSVYRIIRSEQERRVDALEGDKHDVMAA